MEERVKYLEKEFNLYYKYVRESSSYLFDISYGMLEKVDKERKQFSEYWTHEYLYRMYNILCVYFETLELPNYLKKFQDEFEAKIKDDQKSTDFSAIPLEHGDSDDDLELLIEWKKFLSPFDFFWDKQKEKINKKVMDFLDCTNEILKLTKTTVYNEEDINSIIRETAKFYFTGVIAYSEGYFVHQFKHYKPDVIIKEFGIAIEYKLIRKDEEIGNKLDELLIDAKRYVGNHNNKECIAVLCLSREVNKTKKEIKEEWKNMRFPKNWELVIVSDVNIEKKVNEKIRNKRMS